MPTDTQRAPSAEEIEAVGDDVRIAAEDLLEAGRGDGAHPCDDFDDRTEEKVAADVNDARNALIIAIAKRVREAEEGGEPIPTPQANVLLEVARERALQDKQWGGPAHDDQHDAHEWRNFRGGFEKRALDMLESSHVGVYEPADGRIALIRIAALAVAQIEALDRKHPGLGAPAAKVPMPETDLARAIQAERDVHLDVEEWCYCKSCRAARAATDEAVGRVEARIEAAERSRDEWERCAEIHSAGFLREQAANTRTRESAAAEPIRALTAAARAYCEAADRHSESNEEGRGPLFVAARESWYSFASALRTASGTMALPRFLAAFDTTGGNHG